MSDLKKSWLNAGWNQLEDKEFTDNSLEKSAVVACLDIGSNKVAYSLSRLFMPENNIEIVSTGISYHEAYSNGTVTNLDSLVKAIQSAKLEAENIAGLSAQEALVSVGGPEIEIINSHGMVLLKDNEVSEADVEDSIEVAKAIPISSHQSIIHAIPYKFKVDHHEGISHPIGMSGKRLECDIQIITCANSILKNISKACELAGLGLKAFVYKPIATTESILSDFERKKGVILVEMGSSSTQVIAIKDGKIDKSLFFEVGGERFTQDLCMGLKVSRLEAENLKIKSGSAFTHGVSPDDTVIIPSKEDDSFDKEFKKINIAEILEARCEETLLKIKESICSELEVNLYESGIVLAGGGSHLNGLVDMAKYVFDTPVRQGSVLESHLRHPRQTHVNEVCALGMIAFMSKWFMNETFKPSSKEKIGNFMNRMKSMVKGL